MNFDHVLFPIDFSERSRMLTKEVEWLAARFDSRVTLLHVFEIPASWYGGCDGSLINVGCFNELKYSAERRLREYVLNVPEARVERVIAQGDAATEIMNWVNEHDVDLIAMGTHGYSAIQGLLLGSVTAKVLHRATCPVWTDSLLRDRSKHSSISNILCALELTDEAIPLLQFTRQFAQDVGATVRLVHSVPELETQPSRSFDFDLHRYLTDKARIEIAKMQREAGTQFTLSVSGAGISDALAEAAREHAADLVVIGRGKLQKTFGRFQTHVYEILRNASCPVLSYSASQRDRISSSCSAEHLCQCAADEPLPTGCLKS